MATQAFAKCERTEKRIPLSDGFFVANPDNGEWSFVSKDAPEHLADYNIAVANIINTPEALVDWMAHLNEETWFDARKFMDFIARFRKNNALHNEL